MPYHESIFQAIPDAYIITDPNGQVILVNPAFTRLFGFESSEILGRRPQTFFASIDMYKALWESITRNGKASASVLPFRRKDGTVFQGEVTGVVLAEDGRRALRILPADRLTEKLDAREIEGEANRIRLNHYREALKRQDTLPILIGQLLEVGGGEAAGITMVDREGRQFLLEYAAGSWSSLAPRRLKLSEEVKTAVFVDGQIYFAARQDDIARAVGLPSVNIHRAIAVPIQSDSDVLGALWLARKHPFEPEEIQFLVAVAALIATQVDRTRESAGQLRGQIAAFQNLGRAITESLDLNVTIGVFVNEIINHLKVDAVNILIHQPTSRELRLILGRGFRNFNKELHTLQFGRGLAGPAVIEQRVVHWEKLEPDHVQIERRALFQEEGFVGYAALAMIARGEIKGVVEVFHRRPLRISRSQLMFLEAVTTQAAIAVDKSELYEGFHRTQSAMELLLDSTLLGWARALDMRDEFGSRHTQWMIEMTQNVAQDLGMPGDNFPNVRRGVILHDVGKMGVPDRILHKPGPLTDEEWHVMRKHPVYAYEMLSHIPFLRPALEIPYCHHERWNGSGYPRGLRGQSIPLAARIFAVVDVWDAMTSPRPHRGAAPEASARNFIKSNAGELFDPDVVAAFNRRLQEYGIQGEISEQA